MNGYYIHLHVAHLEIMELRCKSARHQLDSEEDRRSRQLSVVTISGILRIDTVSKAYAHGFKCIYKMVLNSSEVVTLGRYVVEGIVIGQHPRDFFCGKRY
jgi:hypothetical protein